jgi:iron complex outermembrane receptor protein
MLRRVFISIISLCTALSLSAEILPDYVVTASREGEDSLDSGARVTVITADEIAQTGKTSVIQVLEEVAGVSFRSFSTEAQAQVSMRGFGENSFGRVLVLVDGRKLNNPDMAAINWQSIQLSSIERIEILDGPSSVLYGSGAVGGVINIITKEGAKGLTAEATLAYGSFDTRKALITGGYGGERVGMIVSADLFWTDGYRDRSATRSTNVTLNSFWDVTDLVTFKPWFSYSMVEFGMPGTLTKRQFDADPTLATKLKDDGSERSYGAGALARFVPGDRLTVECPLDWKKTDRASNWGSGSWTSFADTAVSTIGARPKATWTGETTLGGFALTGGLDFEGNFFEYDSWTDEARTANHGGYEVRQYAAAPYLSATRSFPRGLRAQAGFRWNHATIEAEKGAIDETDAYDSPAWDASLTWRATEEFSAYVRSGSTFRVPFIDEKAEFIFGSVFNDDLDPERGWNAEIGARYRSGNKLSASANAYYLVMDDEIAYGMTNHNVNLDRTGRAGGTVAASWAPSKLVTLDGGVSYVRATFLKGDFEGNEIPLVPALTAKARATFTLPLGLSLGSDVSCSGESWAGGDYANDGDRLDSYTLVGVFAGFSPDAGKNSLTIRFRMDNLLDVSYASQAYYSSSDKSIAYYPADGQSFTVSASFKY